MSNDIIVEVKSKDRKFDLKKALLMGGISFCIILLGWLSFIGGAFYGCGSGMMDGLTCVDPINYGFCDFEGVSYGITTAYKDVIRNNVENQKFCEDVFNLTASS